MHRRICLISFIYCSIFLNSNSLYGQYSANTIDNLILNYDSVCINKNFFENKKQLLNLLNLSDRYNYLLGKSDILRRFGNLYKNNGDFKSAIDAYTKAYYYSELSNDELSSASNCNQLGVLYYNIKEYTLTLYYFTKAYQKYLNLKHYKGMADAAGNISEIYIYLDSIGSALKYSIMGLEARNKCEDTSQIGRNYHSIGLIYQRIKKYDSAKIYYNNALNRFCDFNNTEETSSTLRAIGSLYIEQKQYDSAIFYHRMAYDTADKYQNMPLLAESAFALSKTYEAKGDTLEAFRFLKLASALNDSMLDSTTRKAIVDAERKYDSDAKTQKIELQAAAIKTNKLWMAVISVALLSVVIIAALWINNVANKRGLALKDAELQRSRVGELLQKHEVENVNSMLRGQDAERKRIAQELHDRLGSILATVKLHFSNVQDAISALQQQQTKSYTEANQLLDEACEEVRRISHDLYEGSLVKFGFKTALLQLIAAIEKANALRISFLDNNVGENHYKPFEKDLYRITQELLSNTLKYAAARQVTIQFNLQPNTFVYTYEDDGKGFNPVELQAARGIGYKNIESRVGNTGGTWHVDSRPGHGMTLIIEIPVPDGNH